MSLRKRGPNSKSLPDFLRDIMPTWVQHSDLFQAMYRNALKLTKRECLYLQLRHQNIVVVDIPTEKIAFA